MRWKPGREVGPAPRDRGIAIAAATTAATASPASTADLRLNPDRYADSRRDLIRVLDLPAPSAKPLADGEPFARRVVESKVHLTKCSNRRRADPRPVTRELPVQSGRQPTA